MRHWTIAVFCLIAVFGAGVGMAGNPLSTAKVGDWAETKTITTVNDGKFPIEQTTRKEVLAKDGENVTIRVEATSQGKALAPKEITLPIGEPGQPTESAGTRQLLEERDEAIRIGERTLPCRMTKYLITNEVQGKTVRMTITTWHCESVPITNWARLVVEQEFDRKTTATTEELVDWGPKD